MATVPDWLPNLLEEENLQKYHAYFEYFHHNHKAQGAVALARLGAPYERVKLHCDVKNERYVCLFKQFVYSRHCTGDSRNLALGLSMRNTLLAQ